MNIEQIIEKVVAELPNRIDVTEMLQYELVALQAEHEREMEEFIKEILDGQSTYDNYNNTKCYQAVSVKEIKAIATRRGLLKVTGGEK